MSKKPSDRIIEVQDILLEKRKDLDVANIAILSIVHYLDEEWEKKQEEDKKEKRFQELSDGHKYLVGGKECKHFRTEQFENHSSKCIACGECFSNKTK